MDYIKLAVHVLAMEYYSAIKRNELWTQATTSINLINNILSERNSSQKDTYYKIPFLGYSKKGKTIVIER